MSAPEIEAIRERLQRLRTEQMQNAEQLDRLETHKAQLMHRQALIQGGVQVLEDMLRELQA
jgi:predicted nuclease with TOPRIM domain